MSDDVVLGSGRATAEDEDAENASPVVKRLFVDPTPQKNGRVLGLFDLLSPVKGGLAASPSRKASWDPTRLQDSPSTTRVALVDVSGNAISLDLGKQDMTSTPRKRARTELEAGEESFKTIGNIVNELTSPAKRHSRTPQSAAKRYLLDTFLTPSKRRRLSFSDITTPSKDPSAPSIAAADGTPAFLRRDSQRFSFAALDDVPEDDEDALAGADGAEDGFDTTRLHAMQSPSKSRQRRTMSTLARSNTAPSIRGPQFGVRQAGALRRTGSVRTLSSMIAEMRQTEEDRLDEEMELLREMDGDYMAPPPPPPVTKQQRKERKKNKRASVVVEDSQDVIEAPFPAPSDISAAALGPDREDEGHAESGDEQGPLRRVWKKRGAKRQTRRVVMRPRGRVGAAADLGNAEEHENDATVGLEDSDTIVPETQMLDGDGDVNVDQDVPSDIDAAAADDFEDAEESDFELTIADGSDDDEAEDYDDEPKKSAPSTSAKASAANIVATSPKDSKTNDGHGSTGKPGVMVKAVKKIKATANANYCRLKIRSAKGAAGAKGLAARNKFRRR